MRDYHIHYYLDSCANAEMTFENIEQKCLELGITEGAVLKHYSHALPNGEEDWICWHQIKPADWERFLHEFSAYKPKTMKLYSGVETELCNQQGYINIPLAEQEKIDIIQLSVHYMIHLDCLPMTLMLYPNLSFCPEHNNDEGRRQVERWRQKAADAGAENIIAGLAEGYLNAMKRYPKIRSLAHMADGLKPLRTYLVDVDSVPVSRTIEIFEPMMKYMAESGVVWELLTEAPNTAILQRANELGVSFTATADAHFLDSGWGPLTGHTKAEEFLDSLNLRRGRIEV